MNPRYLSRFVLAVAAAGTSWVSSGFSAENPNGEPLTVPRAKQYDFKPRINGRDYRIMVSTPQKADPNKAYPVFYVLDGNRYFPAAAENMAEAILDLTPAIIVETCAPSTAYGYKAAVTRSSY
jgi:predicted alpha/beta superfamily hydrolase